MDVRSEMQRNEQEIREILSSSLGTATTRLLDAYRTRLDENKEAFVAVLIGRVVSCEGLKRATSRA